MLSNAYFLAKFRFDTAENEPAENLQNFANFPNFAQEGDRGLGLDVGAVVSPDSSIARPVRKAARKADVIKQLHEQ